MHSFTSKTSLTHRAWLKWAMGLGLCFGAISGTLAQTIKIGVIAPLTGPGAPWGMATASGAKILAAEINAKGGLEVAGKKHQVEVIAYDDLYKAGDAVAAYSRLVKQDGAKFVIAMNSAATLAVRQNAEDDKVIVMTSALTEKAFEPGSKYMFRLYSPPNYFLAPLVNWMKTHLKERRLVVLNPNDETGWAQTELSVKLYKDAGFHVLASDLFERTIKDFQPLLTKVLALKPEVIDISTSPPGTAGLLIRQARELGFKGTFVQTGAGAVKEIVATAGKEATEGTISILYADPSNVAYQRLVGEYKKLNSQEPNNIIVAFYDASNVLMSAIQKAGSITDTTKVADAIPTVFPLKSLQGEELGIGGNPVIGANKQVMTVNYVSVLKNGEPVIVGKLK